MGMSGGRTVPSAFGLRSALLGGCASLALSCSLFGGVRVETLDTSAQKPSNVAAVVGVTEDGQPLTDLEAKHFRIYENGQELASGESRRTLLPRESVTHEQVLLLVDLSGQPTPEERSRAVQAVEAFVRKLEDTVPVSVRAFDGSPGLKTVGDYPRGTTAVSAGALARLSVRDQSRDLNGAVVAGLAELDRMARARAKPIELGTLVVFSKGPDLAGRTPAGRVDEAIDEAHHDVIGIGVGEDTPFLSFARGGVVHSQDATTLPIAFEEAGARVAATFQKYYVVAYCSPARAGTRTVRVEVVHENAKGDEHSGSAEFEIDAAGFGPGCDPTSTPRFEHGRPADTSAGARVNESTGAPTGGVVPPPPTGDYAK